MAKGGRCVGPAAYHGARNVEVGGGVAFPRSGQAARSRPGRSFTRARTPRSSRRLWNFWLRLLHHRRSLHQESLSVARSRLQPLRTPLVSTSRHNGTLTPVAPQASPARQLLTSSPVDRDQVRQGHCPPPRPYPGPADKGRGQDRRRHLPPRELRQGAERGQGPGRRPRRPRQGRQEDNPQRRPWRQGPDPPGTWALNTFRRH